jgi:hypothetical protein
MEEYSLQPVMLGKEFKHNLLHPEAQNLVEREIVTTCDGCHSRRVSEESSQNT